MVVQFNAWPSALPSLPRDAAGASAEGAPGQWLDVRPLAESFRLEIMPLARCRGLWPAWTDLARRALEPNVFFEPQALLAAAQHLPEAASIDVALVHDQPATGPGRLLALWPVTRPRGPGDLTRGFTGRYVSCGAPLLDAQLAVEAATALIEQWRRGGPVTQGLLFREVALDGPVAKALRLAADLVGHRWQEVGVHWRACVSREAGDSIGHDDSGKARREMARLRRGLAAQGPLRLVTAREPAAVRDALEYFLALEASGWKARRGTALLQDARSSVYTRTLVRGLAQQGQARVHLLEAGERVAAAGLLLGSRDHAWYVKTAHDEALAAHAPGAVLSHAIAQEAQADPALAQLDSCAVPGHAMIERVWKGRLRVGDLAIGFGAAAEGCLQRDARRARLRHVAKQVYYRIRGLGPSGVPLKERRTAPPATRAG